MFQFFVAGLILWGRALYDAYTYKEKRPEGDVAIPHTEEGSGVPLIFGRCRVREPILSACTDPNTNWTFVSGGHNDGDPVDYGMDMLFLLGIPFRNGRNRLLGIWVGEQRLVDTGRDVSVLDGDGQLSATTSVDDHSGLTFEAPAGMQYQFPSGGGAIVGRVEFLNGKDTQELTDGTFPYGAKTYAAHRLCNASYAGAPTVAADAGEIPGFRGYLSCFMFEPPLAFNEQWIIGRSPQIGSYSFEVSSYPVYGVGPFSQVGVDANPADVIYSILTGPLGKLVIDPARIDILSFAEASYTLALEGHGYSRSFEAGTPAREMIEDVLRQAGGILYEDQNTGLFVLKLIRAIETTIGVRVINVGNCESIDNFRTVTAGSAANLPTQIVVKYTNRDNDYREGTAQTHNLAGADGQSPDSIPLVEEYKGCSNSTLADTLASRDLDIRSRPLKTCSAICDRTMWDITPGSVVWLTWAPLGLSMLMRVVGRNPGSTASNSVTLDLVQEFFTPARLDPIPATFPVHGGSL